MNKLKIRQLLFSLFFLVSLPIACNQSKVQEELSQDGSGETDNYQLVWQDLFDAKALNTDNWQIEEYSNGSGNNELQAYVAQNVALGREEKSGRNCLILTAKRTNDTSKPVTSGRIISDEKMTFTYGKVEASIKLPKTANGLWPAFWILGADYHENGWPYCGEIDILEMGHTNGIKSQTQNTLFNGACHWGPKHSANSHPYYAKETINDYDLQDGEFHLYTLIWDEESIKMYLDMDKFPDAEPYFSMDITQKDSEYSPGHYFHKPFFVIFNLAVGGDFTGLWNVDDISALNDKNGHEARMYVDYVKVYQKKGQKSIAYTTGKLPVY